jgi:hypothetical protein
MPDAQERSSAERPWVKAVTAICSARSLMAFQFRF